MWPLLEAFNRPRGIAPTSPSVNVPAFSAAIVPGCSWCTPLLNWGDRLADGPGKPRLQQGQIRGHLQRSTGGKLTPIHGDFVAFDTLLDAGAAPALGIGDRVYPYPNAAGRAGFGVTVLDATTLEPVSGPDFFDLSGDGSARDGALRAMASSLLAEQFQAAIRSRIFIVQTLGRPDTRSVEWDAVVQRLVAVGASAAYAAPINRPDAAGLQIPTGYTLVSLPGGTVTAGNAVTTVPAVVREATQPAVGALTHLRGVFERKQDSRFEPQLADSAGLVDLNLFDLTYREPSAWPTPSSDPAVGSIRDQLATRGVPYYDDLRQLYWAAIGDPGWSAWPLLLDQVTNTDDLPNFEQVRQQLKAEFLAVQRVRAVLVDTNSVIVKTLLAVASQEQAIIEDIANKLVASLPVTRPPGPSISDIVINVLFMAAGAAGGVGSVVSHVADTAASIVKNVQLGLGVGSALAGISATGMTLNGAITRGGGEFGTSPYEKAIEATENELGTKLAEAIATNIVGFSRMAEVLVSDAGKLAAAAQLFARPEYTDNNSAAIDQARNAILSAAEHEILVELMRAGGEGPYNVKTYQDAAEPIRPLTIPPNTPIEDGVPLACGDAPAYPQPGTVLTTTEGFEGTVPASGPGGCGPIRSRATRRRPTPASSPSSSRRPPRTSPGAARPIGAWAPTRCGSSPRSHRRTSGLRAPATRGASSSWATAGTRTSRRGSPSTPTTAAGSRRSWGSHWS